MSNKMKIDNEILTLKKQLFHKLYSNLNEMQRTAVATVKGPILVLAGAGSGKTTVLVNRIAHILTFGDAFENNIIPDTADIAEMQKLLDNGNQADIKAYLKRFVKSTPKPWNILCITFTNKAANEFKERLTKLLGDTAADIWAGTFHSICVRILRRHINKIGYDNSFSIYDSDDSKRLITECMKKLNISDEKLSVRSVHNEISRAKERYILPDNYELTAGSDFRKQLIAKIYHEYQEELKQASALDFDDLILNTLLLLTQRADVLQDYKEQFQYILADEYQDTNHSQNMLIELLGSDRGNVCVVGDDDQSIYAFRGATIDNILNFDRVFENSSIIRLEQNYRSTKTILNAANALIQNNAGRKGKTLWTENEEGIQILIKKHFTQSEEAAYIMNLIRKRVEEGEVKFSDFAVLYRLNEQSNAFELIFSKSHVPYRIYGGQRFYDRKEIKDVIAYLCVTANTNDETRLRRIINLPRRGIGNTTIATLSSVAAREGLPIYEVIRNVELYPELSKSKSSIQVFYNLIEDLRYLSNNCTLGEFVENVITKTGYKTMLQESVTEKDRIKNIEELISSAILFEQNSETKSLSSFLEEIALVSDIDNYDTDSDAVTMMTMHSAKGLEFPVVFLPGFEDGVFPSMQALEGNELEEERRLAYVALTRAKKELIITHTKTRLLYGRTTSNPISRFSEEIPTEYTVVEDTPKVETRSHTNYVSDAMTRSAGAFVKNSYQYEAPKKSTAAHPIAKNTFSVGDRISHASFGTGIITEAEVMGPDIIYTIEFDSQGKRKLMASYAKLTMAE